MAKSKRSKVKRAFRAEKRHRLRPKAAAQLKKIISCPIGGTGLPYVDASKITAPEVIVLPEEEMVVEGKTAPKLLNEHGNYPIWMSKKEMRRNIGLRKRVLNKKKKIKSRNN